MSSKNKLIINCGASHVSVAEFGTASGRLVLESFQMQELNYDYSVQENWLNALTFALKTMKVSGKATIIAPSMLLLTKTIKIPHVEPDRRAEVIAFEAEKIFRIRLPMSLGTTRLFPMTALKLKYS